MERLVWHTEQVLVKDLVPLDINPRKISEAKRAALIGSLDEFNLVEIPAVNTDLVVIGGNQRVQALLLTGRGDEVIDVRMPNRKLTKAELKKYALISNTHAGEFDFEKLEREFAEISFPDFDFKIDGWDEWENKKARDLAAAAKDDEFEVPDGGLKTEIKVGDVFEIGKHRLVCGDSTKRDTWAKLMGDEMADLVLTDPPYNVKYESKGAKRMSILGDKQSDSDFYKFLFDFYTACRAFTKKGAPWYVWHAGSESINFISAMSAAGVTLRQILVWVKNNASFTRSDYREMHEPCLYAWAEGEKHSWYGDRKQTTVLNFKRPLKNDKHPTMKPVPLIAYQIGNSSKEGGIVVDGFGGSGTTMVAAEQMRRECRMIEVDPKYCQVIIERMINAFPDIKVVRNGVEWGWVH